MLFQFKFKLEDSLRFECRVSIFFVDACLDLAAGVVPGIADITANPVLSINLLNLSVTHIARVDLIAVVTFVAILVAGVAVLAEAYFLLGRIECDFYPLSVNQLGSALVTCRNRAISVAGLVHLGSDDLLLLGWVEVLEAQLIEARLNLGLFCSQVSYRKERDLNTKEQSFNSIDYFLRILEL